MEPLVGSLRERATSSCSCRTLQSWFPVLSWLPHYNLRWLQMDLVAGLTVGLTTVPQALAYAEVAGLPVQYGLYSAFMGCFIYCVFGTSKDVTLGPTAIMSLLCASYMGSDPVYAVLLSFLCGSIQAAMAILRLGFLLDFISYPVIKGFTCAAAITIGFGQVKNIFGLKNIPQQFVLQVYYTFHRIPEARLGDVVLGLSCLALLVSLTWMKTDLVSPSPEHPTYVKVAHGLVWGCATIRNVLVVIMASCVAFSFEISNHHYFTLTGQTAKGLPPFKPPAFSETKANGTIIYFKEIVLVSTQVFTLLTKWSQNGYRIDTNQELFAIGLTNIMGSFVSAYPVTGSFGRTAVNSQTGVCTPAGGVVTGVIVLLSLAFLMPVFYYIPKASLAAVIICAVAPMADWRAPLQLWRVRKLDLLPFMVTFLVSFWEVQYGIVGGVLVSGAMLLYHMARPHIEVHDHGVLVMDLDSGLNFPATEHLNQVIYSQALHVSPPRCVVLNCHHISSVDCTVVHELKDLLKQFRLRNVSLVFSGLKNSVLEVLLAGDLPGLKYTDSIETALQILSGNTHFD
uniref:Sodium-independent sulfate anion transporter n=1 Tax=Denticeps clupeoides TaxID=299321 RepID=A0AAY4EED6_9TELE